MGNNIKNWHLGSHGQVVMGGDSCLKVVGSNPSTVYRMDTFSQTFVVAVEMFVRKDENK